MEHLIQKVGIASFIHFGEILGEKSLRRFDLKPLALNYSKQILIEEVKGVQKVIFTSIFA